MPADPISSAAVALAEASAAAGTASARLGYALTTKSLDESTAAAVFPLLALELTAIAESFVAYIAVDAAWETARLAAAAEFAAATAARVSSP